MIPRWLLSAMLLVLQLHASPATADDTAAANRSFVAAMSSWIEAMALAGDELEILERRLELLEHVSESLNRIVQEYPGSDLAVRLIIGDQIGPLSISAASAELLDTRIRLDRERCWASPNRNCLLTIAIETTRSIEDRRLHTIALTRIAELTANQSFFEDSRAMASEITEPRHISALLFRIVSAQARAGLFREARETALSSDVGASERIRAIARIMAQAGLISEALELVLDVSEPDQLALAISEVAANQQDSILFERAVEVALGMDDRSEPLIEISRNMARSGFLLEAIQTSRLIESSTGRDGLLVEISAILASNGLFQQALDLHLEVQEPFHQFRIILEVAKLRGGQDLFARAQDMAREMDHPLNRSWALARLAGALLDRDLFQEAIDVARDNEPRADSVANALLDIAAVQSDVGMLGEALELLGEALELLREELRTTQRDVRQGRYDNTFRRIGERFAEARVFDQAISIAHEMSAGVNRRNLLRSIANLQAGDGLFDDALETARMSGDSVSGGVAIAMAEAGLISDAIEAVHGIQDSFYRAMTVAGIAAVVAE